MISRRDLLTMVGGSLLLEDVEPPPFTTTARLRPPLRFPTRLLPLGFETHRLRDIYLDADGEAWIGANEPDRHIPVVRLRTGKARKFDMNLGEGQYLDMVLPIGNQIVVCGGAYARQVILDRKTGQRQELPMARENPLIYGGLIVGTSAYLFDCNHGLYRWDTRDNRSQFYPYPFTGRPPVGGLYVPSKRAIYAIPWWQEGMPLPKMVKFDCRTEQFTAEFTPPWPDVRPMVPVQMGNRLYQTDMFGGTLMVFDLKRERWIGRYRLPGYEQSWKYIATTTVFGPFIICCLSTFQGIKNAAGTYGFDGHRHHFVNRILAFDTRQETATLLDVPALSKTGYATIAYLRTLQGRLYGTCVDSTLQTDGKPNEHGAAYLVEFTLPTQGSRR